MAGPDEKASIGFAYDSISEERVTEAHTLAPVRRIVVGQFVRPLFPMDHVIYNDLKYMIAVMNKPGAQNLALVVQHLPHLM